MTSAPTRLQTDDLLSLGRLRKASPSVEYLPAVATASVAAVEALTILLGCAVYFSATDAYGAHGLRYLWAAVPIAAAIEAAFACLGLYRFNTLIPPSGSLPRIAAGSCLSLPISYIGMRFLLMPYPLLRCCGIVPAMIAALSAERWIVDAAINSLARHGWITRNAVIVGPQSGLLRALRGPLRPWTRILGIVAGDGEPGTVTGLVTQGCSRLETIDELIELARHARIDDVFLTLPEPSGERVCELLEKLRVLAVNVYLSPGLSPGLPCGPAAAGGDACFGARLASKPLDGWRGVAKLAEDKIVAILAVVLLLPVFGLVALAIRLDSTGPVLFRQKRIGLHNQLIEIYKFRTMFDDQRDDDAERLATKGDPRVTPVGRFLRQTGIDELPQFLNVLEGDMSVVGPRPHAVKAKAGGKLYGQAVARYAERHRIKPGITGWAQVNGWRGDADGEEGLRRRVEFDIHYVENWSILFDIRIMLRTVRVMLSGSGAC